MKRHCCDHSLAEKRTRALDGTAPGRWAACAESEAGAVQRDDGWVRWVETGAPKTYSTHKHPLPEGVASRITHVTTRFGSLPHGAGVVHWLIEDGHLVVRPALDIDLGIEVHLRDEVDAP